MPVFLPESEPLESLYEDAWGHWPHRVELGYSMLCHTRHPRSSRIQRIRVPAGVLRWRLGDRDDLPLHYRLTPGPLLYPLLDPLLYRVEKWTVSEGGNTF